MRIGYICTSLAALLMAACAAPTPREPIKGHLNGDNAPVAATGSIPPPVQQTLALPKPRPTR
ncbi:MAG: type II and III secretion system protein, partial [Rhodocyclaceae bacterium]|nr:type II and III secretion system protein [Rhodocyclaceae bacterium]